MMESSSKSSAIKKILQSTLGDSSVGVSEARLARILRQHVVVGASSSSSSSSNPTVVRRANEAALAILKEIQGSRNSSNSNNSSSDQHKSRGGAGLTINAKLTRSGSASVQAPLLGKGGGGLIGATDPHFASFDSVDTSEPVYATGGFDEEALLAMLTDQLLALDNDTDGWDDIVSLGGGGGGGGASSGEDDDNHLVNRDSKGTNAAGAGGAPLTISDGDAHKHNINNSSHSTTAAARNGQNSTTTSVPPMGRVLSFSNSSPRATFSTAAASLDPNAGIPVAALLARLRAVGMPDAIRLFGDGLDLDDVISIATIRRVLSQEDVPARDVLHDVVKTVSPDASGVLSRRGSTSLVLTNQPSLGKLDPSSPTQPQQQQQQSTMRSLPSSVRRRHSAAHMHNNNGNNKPVARLAPLSAVTDPATLYRRLGGDPEDVHVFISKSRLLQGFHATLGMSIAEVHAYKRAIEQSPKDRLTFPDFLDVVSTADGIFSLLLTKGSSLLHEPSEAQSDDDDEFEESNSLALTDSMASPSVRFDVKPPSATSAPVGGGLTSGGGGGATGTSGGGGGGTVGFGLHDAAAMFLFHAAQGRRRSMGGSEKLKHRLAKTLNDHIAKTHRNCLFPKPLVYLLRLDVQLLNAFALRSRGRQRTSQHSVCVLGIKILRTIERIVALLKSHSTCQVCYLAIDPNKKAELPSCAVSATPLVGFMRLPPAPPSSLALLNMFHEAPNNANLNAATHPRLSLSPNNRRLSGSSNNSTIPPPCDALSPSRRPSMSPTQAPLAQGGGRSHSSSGATPVEQLPSDLATTGPNDNNKSQVKAKRPAPPFLRPEGFTRRRAKQNAARLETFMAFSPANMASSSPTRSHATTATTTRSQAKGKRSYTNVSPRLLSHLDDPDRKLMEIFKRQSLEEKHHVTRSW